MVTFSSVAEVVLFFFFSTVLAARKKVKKTSLLFTSELVSGSIYDTVHKGLPEDGHIFNL